MTAFERGYMEMYTLYPWLVWGLVLVLWLIALYVFCLGLLRLPEFLEKVVEAWKQLRR